MARSSQRESHSKLWLRAIGNAIGLPTAAVTAYEFFRVLGSGAVAIFSAVPISAQGLYAGGFAFSVVILAYSNWFIIDRFCESIRRKRTAAQNQKFEEQQAVQQAIAELLSRLSRGMQHSSPGDRARVEILKRYLTEIGLAPPADSDEINWHYHFSRLEEYVKAYGIEGARAEMKDWYDNTGNSE